jgi:hypothetical protein
VTAYHDGAIQDASDATRDPTAVAGRRIVAAVVDGLVVTVPTLLLASRELEYLEQQDVGVPLDTFCDIQRADHEGAVCMQALDRVYFTDGELSPVPSLLALGLALALLVVVQGLTSLTPGKALLGIRTVGEDGRPPGIRRALGRWLLLIVDTAPWFLPLVGLITVLTTVGHRRVGDMAAKTYVVSRADAGQPIVVPGMPVEPVESARPLQPVRPDGQATGEAKAVPEGEPTAETRPDEDDSPRPKHLPARRSARHRAKGAGVAKNAKGPAARREAAVAAAGAKDKTASSAAGQPAPGSTGKDTGYNPQWDPARGTYIVWEPRRGKWLAWDSGAEEWKSL